MIANLISNYRQALAYLDTCGPFNEEKLREANRIAGNPNPEEDIQRLVRLAPMTFDGMEGVRIKMRDSFEQGIKLLETLGAC